MEPLVAGITVGIIGSTPFFQKVVCYDWTRKAPKTYRAFEAWIGLVQKDASSTSSTSCSKEAACNPPT